MFSKLKLGQDKLTLGKGTCFVSKDVTVLHSKNIAMSFERRLLFVRHPSVKKIGYQTNLKDVTFHQRKTRSHSLLLIVFYSFFNEQRTSRDT